MTAPPDLARFFAFDPIDGAQLMREFGISKVEGDFVMADSVLSPFLTVCPMGWSWAFWFVQAAHIHVLDMCGFNEERRLRDNAPPPELRSEPISMPYCDNLTVIGTSQERVGFEREVVSDTFKRLGFRMHEETPAETDAKILGYALEDGHVIRANPEKALNVQFALRWVAKGRHVTGREIERLLGHYIHLVLVRRELLAPMRHLYDFIAASYHVRRPLFPSAAREARVLAALLPLARWDLRTPWAARLAATDASETGLGLCERECRPAVARAAGEWSELWRFRRLPPEEWRPRAHAGVEFGDPTLDPRTVDPPFFGVDSRAFEADPRFPEIGRSIWAEEWRSVLSTRCRWREHITLLEGRAFLLGLRRSTRSSAQHGRRHVRIVDNFGLALSLSRFRARDFAMLRVSQSVAALSLASDMQCRVRWVPSERNPADAPSRAFEHARAAGAARAGVGPAVAAVGRPGPWQRAAAPRAEAAPQAARAGAPSRRGPAGGARCREQRRGLRAPRALPAGGATRPGAEPRGAARAEVHRAAARAAAARGSAAYAPRIVRRLVPNGAVHSGGPGCQARHEVPVRLAPPQVPGVCIGPAPAARLPAGGRRGAGGVLR